LLGSISPVPAQAAASAGAPGAAVAHVVTAATARQGIVVTLKKTPATLSATFTTDPNGKVRLLLTSNAKKVKVKYVTAKGKKKTLTVTIKKGTKTVLLPAGATKIKAQAKATTKLSASPWVIATVPAPVVPAPVVPPDVTPPGPVAALVVGQVTASSIALSWTNPADADLAEVIVRRSEGSVPPSTPTAGTGVALTSAMATSVVNTGLAGNTTYSYALFTRDATGNINPTPATATTTTLPGQPGESVLGAGVTKVSDSVGGSPDQVGYVDGFVPGQKVWLLSTGRVADSAGTPDMFASTDLGQPGSTRLSGMIGGTETFDASSYTVTLSPAGSHLHVQYVFASEEYPEWVGSSFNDVMAVFVDGVNCAFVPGTTDAVAVNNVNAETNATYFIDNSVPAAGYATSMDGLTVPLTCTVPVTPGVPVTVEISIADTADAIYDSAVALTDKGIWSD
jgi:hypothetical protein